MSRSTDATVETKRSEALSLRGQGYSYRAIGAALGISHSSAHEYCAPVSHALANRRRREHYRRSPEHQAATKARLRLRRSEDTP